MEGTPKVDVAEAPATAKTPRSAPRRRLLSIAGLFAALVLVIGINVISESFLGRYRVDLTEQRLYTLSDGTKSVLSSIPEPITLRLYYSSRLGQVFLNLIVNAAQAIPDGAAEHNLIRLATATGTDGYAEVMVTDTGSGIQAGLLERIFEPFVTMKPVGVGTGLGLYICRDIIHHLGGVIEVESELGKGSTFKVRLPPAPSEVRAGPLSSTPSRQREKELPRSRILVIDDEPNIGRSFVRSLPEHDVTFVDSGREGIRRLDAGERFDLIFCDVMMPDLTGRDVHEQIGERHASMLERIVFMTGGAFTERASEFIERVNARRVDKPFDVATIRTVLREKLDPTYDGS